MDEVYGFYNKTSSETLDLAKYFKEYNDLTNLKSLAELRSNRNEKAGILEIMQMDVNDEDFAVLSEYCSIENLTIPGESFEKYDDTRLGNRKGTYEVKEIPKDVNLETLTKLKERIGLPQRPFVHNLKYRSEICIEPEKVETFKCNSLMEPGNEMLVFVRIYAPFVHQHRLSSVYVSKIFTTHIVAILGSQTLAELRDIISCTSDLSIAKEVSANPDAGARQPQAKEVYKSGFFYIESTFYNDFRDPSNMDNSEVIREWAKKRNLGPFKTASMESVTINSLSVKFGYPWVYQHQGTCEHLLVFSDARLIGPSDNLTISSYPRIHRMRASSTKYCMVCGVFAASWITTHNDRLPHDPCYFCTTCFHSFNYIDGKKIENFLAYPVPFGDVAQD
ncbi:snRNA-activating protein complex subunit 3 isoform X1 [Neodiprion pinetum]|uniref:snRNA-activating protein complex subunit 3 isoform X1 n=1 Tax=Neodiprion pinetum TaxID=441929 RepID=UPI001EE0F7C5|nr:snRNA-activating protein complex subunit 3 isoform X1 [Neodiprion pinetum]XP_046481214.1 snRNA-activating protein complex subunit 3 isoform X1 [Neodiprion pinetum]XP_046622443.1 snRNA-activating protein complex subunit 3 isoform X1 [Neodiprion virginianus]XP_046622444.1 snRNA-activating protein complex subunit 3 isoform X1 [Neodiprion virginianus]